LTFPKDNVTAIADIPREVLMIDPTHAAAWIAAGKAGLDLLRAAWHPLPKSDEKDRIGTKLEEAERALDLSKAKLAKELGFRLCQCQFPPKPMLWDNARSAFVCQNAECGRVDAVAKPADALRRRGKKHAQSG
jgi:hypothetical protein